MNKKSCKAIIGAVMTCAMCAMMIGCGNREAGTGGGNQSTESQCVQESKTYDEDCLDSPNEDGLYVWNGMTFKYKLWITDGGGSFVVVSNRKDVTAKDVEKQQTSSALVPDDTSFYASKILVTTKTCEVDKDGKFLYDGKAYKKVIEFTEKTDSSEEYVHTVLTNDEDITLDDVLKAGSGDNDRFVVIQKTKL